jgi:hypothetical protein
MRKPFLLAAMTMVLAAAAPPDPVITLDGVSSAAKLSAELRTAVAPKVKSLNTALEHIVAGKTGAPSAGPEQRVRTHQEMKARHDDIHKLIQELMQRLDPEQRAALHEYLHGQMRAAGIELPAHHGPGMHRPHGNEDQAGVGPAA